MRAAGVVWTGNLHAQPDPSGRGLMQPEPLGTNQLL